MPRVDGYCLSPGLPDALDRFACKLVEKAFQQGYSIKVQTRDPTHSEALDRLLWTFRDRSFIPHDRVASPDCPVWITDLDQTQDVPEYRLLVQIQPVCQDHSRSTYERIVEIMDSDHRSLPAHQANWERYRSLGYEIHEHDHHPTT